MSMNICQTFFFMCVWKVQLCDKNLFGIAIRVVLALLLASELASQVVEVPKQNENDIRSGAERYFWGRPCIVVIEGRRE